MIPTSRLTDASSPSGGVQVATGTYVGNGALTQAIVGVGFQPKFVMIYPHDNGSVLDFPIGFRTDRDGGFAYWWWRGAGPGTFDYDLGNIISLDVDGFTVGDGSIGLTPNNFNALGVTYTYLCWG